MFAHSRAIVSLALFAAFATAAEPGGTGRESLILVYLDAGSHADSATLSYMRREAEGQMLAAGFHTVWRDPKAPRETEDAADIVMLKLDGACAVPAGQATASPTSDAAEQLAGTSMVDGRILPYGRIDCGALTRLLAVPLSSETAGRRTFLYGRAMGRLIAHELYHILAQTVEHSAFGVAKPSFNPGDLTGEVFEFEPGALARLRRQAGGGAVASMAAERE